MCVSNTVMFTNHIPDAILFMLSFVPIGFFYIFFQKFAITSKQIPILSYLTLLYLLLYIKHPDNGFFRLAVMVGCLFNIASVLLLPTNDKLKLLDFISKIMAVFLLFSSIGWILYLLGYNIPICEFVDLHDDMHYLDNHYIFYDNAERDIFSFPRFRSFFIEPGQLATPCVFLFFARGARFKDWKNIVFLTSVFLSFSLAGYVLLCLGFLLNLLFVNKKISYVKLIIGLFFVGTIVFVTIQAANEDNPLFSLIYERLEYDEEKGIAGNNRSDMTFDRNFSNYLNSGSIVFGMGDEMAQGEMNWANHASGIKKFFVNFGIAGILALIMVTVSLLKPNYCRAALVFFVVIWTAQIVRDLLQSQFWLIIAILGFFNLKDKS